MAALPATIAGQQDTDVNPATTELRQQLAEAQMQLATARQRYTDKYPAVVALEQQRDQLQRQLASEPVTVAGQTIAIPNPVFQQLSQQAATLRSHIQGDIAQIAELQRRRSALAPAIAALPAQTTQLGLLAERAKLASDVYKALEQKYDDAVVSSNSAISDVTVVQAAESDNASVSPNLAFNIIASIVIGLMLALLAVAIANATHRKIREDRDVEHVLGLPVIAHIPSLPKQNQPALPWLQTATLEGFLQLCASLRILGRKSGTHVIVITSPEKGDGKTTIAFYLASAMSKVRSRVLLVDADMRCPATHVQAKIENSAGLSEILSGQRPFDEVVVHYTATLDVLTAGALPANPVALAESAAFDELLDLARDRYDCIIIDTPALTPVVDSALIATRADSTAIVLSANNSHEGAAGQAVARLRALGIDNILGVIMNRTKAQFPDYSDYFVSAQRALPSTR
jgi:capsular exopolysaccharide synthesis family protein